MLKFINRGCRPAIYRTQVRGSTIVISISRLFRGSQGNGKVNARGSQSHVTIYRIKSTEWIQDVNMTIPAIDGIHNILIKQNLYTSLSDVTS